MLVKYLIPRLGISQGSFASYNMNGKCDAWNEDLDYITVILMCFSGSSETIPKVTEVIPKYGSINGATRLTIKGEGVPALCVSTCKHQE